MFYCLVAGSRTFTDYSLLSERLDHFLSVKMTAGQEITIVSGGAQGADTFAKCYAKENGFAYMEFNADWFHYGKSAGYKRNKQMHRYIAQFEDRGCVCFWDGQSKGTQHNFALAEQYNTPLRIVLYHPQLRG